MNIEQPTFPLSSTAFESALRKGQGRVLQHIARHGVAGLQDQIIGNCLHSHSYDPQSESPRAPWLFTIVEKAGLKREVIQAIGAMVREPPEQDHCDLSQRSALLKELAAAGEVDARELLYRSLIRMSDTASVIADEDIVALDGVDGLIMVARQNGRWLQEDPDFWVNNYFVEQLDESRGAAVGLSALEHAAESDADVARYLDGLRQNRERLDANRPRAADAAFTGAQIVAHAQKQTKEKCFWFRNWGMRASVAEREVVFSALLDEQTPTVVARLLRCFGKTGIPRYDGRLLPWLFCSDEQVRWAAVQAVSQLTHPDLRQAALRLIADGDLPNGVRLLVANFEEGDLSMCAGLLSPSDDAEHHHSLGWYLLKLCAAHQGPKALDCLLYIYEYSPCSDCRRRAVGLLVDTDVAPAWLLEESTFDSDPQTRVLASKALSHTG